MTIDSMRLRQLQYFVEVARNGSIGKAAESFNVSQPAITKRIKDLERDLGMALFTRSRAGVALTPYGEIFLQSAKAIVDEMNTATSRLETFKKAEKGSISIGGMHMANSRIVPLAVARFKARRPLVTVNMLGGTHDQLLASLRAGQVDLVYGRRGEPSQMSGLTYEVLAKERLVLLVRHGHPVAKRAGLVLSHLVDYPWIVPLPSTTLRRSVDKLFERSGVPFPRNCVECVIGPAMQVYIAETDAIAALPDKLFETEVKVGKLIQLMDMESPLGDVGITRRDTPAPTPLVRMLIQELRRIAVRFR